MQPGVPDSYAMHDRTQLLTMSKWHCLVALAALPVYDACLCRAAVPMYLRVWVVMWVGVSVAMDGCVVWVSV